MATVNLLEAQRFLDLLAPGDEFTFQTFDDSKSHRGSLARVLHGTFDQHAYMLAKLNQAGAGVFVMVNAGDGVIKDGNQTVRTNANVTRVRAVFVDLDGSPLQPALEAGARPHIVVESSPGRWHVYWKTNDTSLEDFSACQAGLAVKFNGDASVKDLARVMRLPGFLHQKAEPFMTRIIAPL